MQRTSNMFFFTFPGNDTGMPILPLLLTIEKI